MVHFVDVVWCHVIRPQWVNPWRRRDMDSYSSNLAKYMYISHYLNQHWLIVNGTLKNKLQWNLNQNTAFFIHAFETVVCEMADILSRGRWVKGQIEVRDIWYTNHEDILTFYDDDVIMSAIASQITSLTIVYSTVYSGADERKYQSSASLAFVRGIHRWPVNSPHKGPVTLKMFPFDDVVMFSNKYVLRSMLLKFTSLLCIKGPKSVRWKYSRFL